MKNPLDSLASRSREMLKGVLTDPKVADSLKDALSDPKVVAAAKEATGDIVQEVKIAREQAMEIANNVLEEVKLAREYVMDMSDKLYLEVKQEVRQAQRILLLAGAACGVASVVTVMAGGAYLWKLRTSSRAAAAVLSRTVAPPSKGKIRS